MELSKDGLSEGEGVGAAQIFSRKLYVMGRAHFQQKMMRDKVTLK